MYPSSASSSSQGSMGTSSGGGGGGGGGGLTRYGSAPSSVLSAAVDSVIGSTPDLPAQSHFGHSRFFASEASESEGGPPRRSREEANTAIGLQPSFGFGGGGGSNSLLRHSSSPAGFLNQFAAAAGGGGDANGFSITRSGLGSYNSKGMADTGGGLSRLNSQHSFTGKESLTRISEETDDITIRRSNNVTDDDDDNNNNNSNGQRKQTHSYAANSGGAVAYGMGSWPEHNMFSVAPPGRGKNNAVDALDSIESQFQFSISQTAQDMASMEKLLNIPQDSITCKIRAKRGCATHPRSIAERERRTRISGKLKKLQDLVPNMDKQTSYADMLDLAVQHIKTLQNEVQKLNHDLDSCSCGCKNPRDS